MLMVVKAWMRTALCACLSVSAVTGKASMDECRIPVVRSAEQAPVIDGVMKGGEWKYALAVTGLISNEGAFSQRQATIYYVSDGSSLYVGAYAPAVPEGTAPQVCQGPKYDGKNYMDFVQNDRIEAKFSPPDRIDSGDLYIVADAAGNKLVLKIKGEERPIQPDWEYRTSFDEKGWTIEMRVPLAIFGKDPLNGHWGLNFTFARLFPRKYEGLSSGGPHGLCGAALAHDAPAVQISGLTDLPKGKVDFAVSVREYEGLVATPKEGAYDEREVESGGMALKGGGKIARVAWELLDADGKKVSEESKCIELRPARKLSASFSKEFSPAAKNTLRVKVEMADDAKAFDGNGGTAKIAKIATLYAATFPFRPYDESEAKQWQERLTKGTLLNSWRFNPAFFPYWGKAKVQTVFFKGAVRDQARKLRVTITSDKGFKAERETPIVDGVMQADTPDRLLDIPIPGLPEGSYKACGEVLDADGKLVSRLESEYVRKVFPWEHNTLGLSRGVIKPWTPMNVNGSSVECWGRSYEIGADGLPASISSQGGSLLAHPVSVEIRGADGVVAKVSTSGKTTFTEKAEDRVTWHAQGSVGGDVAVKLTGMAEYDGFTWYELTLEPRKPVETLSGRIVIALPESQAQLMHFQSCWARSNFSGAIPRGEGVVFRSLDTKNYGRTGGFSPHVWIGNPTRGLSWFADSDEGWSSAADKSALEIARSEKQVQLVMNIIAKPTTLDKPRTIRFGLMATPFKPLMPIRDIQTRAVNWLSFKDNKTVVQDHMYATYPPKFNYALIDEHVPGKRLYFNKHEMGAALPERAVFDSEWGGMEPAGDYPGAPERFGPGLASRVINRSHTDSRIDMLVYYIAEMARKSSMAATYWDLTGISTSGPMLENGAYVNPETGEIQQTFDIVKSRQLFKRVATMWQELKGEPDLMEIHSTNHMGVPFYSFAYSWLNFEWLWPNDKALRPDGRWQDFIDLRPLDLFATEGSPSQFGVWINSINAGGRPDDPAEHRRVARSASALAMLHNHNNAGMGGSGLTPPPSIGRRDQVEFVGYLDEKGRITTDHELVRASYWRKDGKIEFVAVNLSLEPRTATITIPLAPLGWKEAGNVVETTGEPELTAICDALRRKGNGDKAKEVEGLIASTTSARNTPTVKVVDNSLRITFELTSHDYRLFTAEGR